MPVPPDCPPCIAIVLYYLFFACFFYQVNLVDSTKTRYGVFKRGNIAIRGIHNGEDVRPQES